MNFLIADKIETAMVAIADPLTTLNVYPGKSSSEKAAPCAICSAEISEDEDPQGSGNFPVQCRIDVKQSAVTNEDGTDPEAASPKTDTQTEAAAIFAGFMVDNLAGLLTAATDDLTVFSGSVQFGPPESGRDESGLWIDSLQFRCYACGSALS